MKTTDGGDDAMKTTDGRGTLVCILLVVVFFSSNQEPGFFEGERGDVRHSRHGSHGGDLLAAVDFGEEGVEFLELVGDRGVEEPELVDVLAQGVVLDLGAGVVDVVVLGPDVVGLDRRVVLLEGVAQVGAERHDLRPLAGAPGADVGLLQQLRRLPRRRHRRQRPDARRRLMGLGGGRGEGQGGRREGQDSEGRHAVCPRVARSE
mmetsp:Transcript_5969/g.19401  ORF Transcript_5969/g.19401 Transcript_5969/m.19401 type:complete len:205 (-) Transcript_5969:137-751(-)